MTSSAIKVDGLLVKENPLPLTEVTKLENNKSSESEGVTNTITINHPKQFCYN